MSLLELKTNFNQGWHTTKMTETITVEETSHSIFSPSGSSRWLKCPGSIALEKQMKLEKQPPSIYAMEGTAAHELARVCLRQNSEAKKFLGQHIMEFEITHEMVNAIQTYLDFVNQHRTFESLILIEQTADLSFLYEGMKGTADAVIENPKDLHVFDLKYGKGVPVEAHDPETGGPNTQLGLYAIAQLRAIFQKRGNLDHIEEIYLHIVQPRCPHPEGPIRTFRTSVEELRDLSQHARERIANACSEDPDFNPGEKQCQWCPAAPICRHLANYNLQLAKMEFADLKTPDSSPPDPNTFSKQEISIILKHSKTFENWLRAVSTYALNELRIGHSIPEFKLVRKRANRVWKDEQQALEFLRTNMELSEEELYRKRFVSPAQAEQLVGRKHKEDLEFLITKPVGDITIAHQDDARPPADPTDGAISDFSGFIKGGDE